MTHTIEQAITHEAPSTGTEPQQPPRRSRRTVLGWAAVAVGLVAAVALVLLTITSDPSPQRNTDPTPPRTRSSAAGRRAPDVGGRRRALPRRPPELPPGRCPGSADGAERYLADHQSSRPAGVPDVGGRRRALPRRPSVEAGRAHHPNRKLAPARGNAGQSQFCSHPFWVVPARGRRRHGSAGV